MAEYYVGLGFNYWTELQIEADSVRAAEEIAREKVFDKFMNEDAGLTDVDVEYVEEAD